MAPTSSRQTKRLRSFEEHVDAWHEALGTTHVWYGSDVTREAKHFGSRVAGIVYLDRFHKLSRVFSEPWSFTHKPSQADTMVVTVGFSDVDVADLRSSGVGSAAIDLMRFREEPEAAAYALDYKGAEWFYGSSLEHENLAWLFGVTLAMPGTEATPTATEAKADEEYTEWQWIEESEAWLRENYAGLWIAVVDNGVVAVAESEVDALIQARDLGYKKCFSHYVPTDSEPAVFAGI